MAQRDRSEQPVVQFDDEQEWQRWLHEHHADSDGVWLRLAKKKSGVTTVTYAQALDVALCYGWIDGQMRSLDERFYLQRFTPRRKRSSWSQRNTEHVERLLAEGRMHPAGLREVEAAKADGRWQQAYAPPSTMEVPDDFAAALAASPKAKAAFDTLSRSNRYSFCWRVNDAKRPQTRARRIEKFVAMLERGEHDL